MSMQDPRLFAMEHYLQELVAQRRIIEEKCRLRQATSAEFSALHRQTVDAARKRLEADYKLARERNLKWLEEVSAATVSNDLSPQVRSLASASAQLARARVTYVKCADALLPAWQNEQADRRMHEAAKLRRDREAIEARREASVRDAEAELRACMLLEEERRKYLLATALESRDYAVIHARASALAEESRAVDAVFMNEQLGIDALAERERVLALGSVDGAASSNPLLGADTIHRRISCAPLPGMPRATSADRSRLDAIATELGTSEDIHSPGSEATAHDPVTSQDIDMPLVGSTLLPAVTPALPTGSASLIARRSHALGCSVGLAVQVHAPVMEHPTTTTTPDASTNTTTGAAADASMRRVSSPTMHSSTASAPAAHPGHTSSRPATPTTVTTATATSSGTVAANGVQGNNHTSGSIDAVTTAPSPRGITYAISSLTHSGANDSDVLASPASFVFSDLDVSERSRLLGRLCARIEALDDAAMGRERDDSLYVATDENFVTAIQAYRKAAAKLLGYKSDSITGLPGFKLRGSAIALHDEKQLQDMCDVFLSGSDYQVSSYGIINLAEAVMHILIEIGPRLLPSDVLNGVVTIEKVNRSLRALGDGRLELWDILIRHIRNLVLSNYGIAEEISRVVTEALVCLSSDISSSGGSSDYPSASGASLNASATDRAKRKILTLIHMQALPPDSPQHRPVSPREPDGSGGATGSSRLHRSSPSGAHYISSSSNNSNNDSGIGLISGGRLVESRPLSAGSRLASPEVPIASKNSEAASTVGIAAPSASLTRAASPALVTSTPAGRIRSPISRAMAPPSPVSSTQHPSPKSEELIALSAKEAGKATTTRNSPSSLSSAPTGTNTSASLRDRSRALLEGGDVSSTIPPYNHHLYHQVHQHQRAQTPLLSSRIEQQDQKEDEMHSAQADPYTSLASPLPSPLPRGGGFALHLPPSHGASSPLNRNHNVFDATNTHTTNTHATNTRNAASIEGLQRPYTAPSGSTSAPVIAAAEDSSRKALTTAGSGNSNSSSGGSSTSKVDWKKFIVTKRSSFGIEADELASDDDFEIAAPRPTKDIETNILTTASSNGSHSNSATVANAGATGEAGGVSEFDF